MAHYHKKKWLSQLAPWIVRSGVHKLMAPYAQGFGHILTLHRVCPDQSGLRIHNHQSLEISPVQLEETIQFYKRSKYSFISLNELYDCFQKKKFDRKVVAFTFDDGYRDNYTEAYPILKAHAVPFCVYITTDFPDRKAVLWWYLLEKMIVEQTELAFRFQDTDIVQDLHTTLEKEMAFNQLRRLITQSVDWADPAPALSAILGDYWQQAETLVDQLALSWQEIRLLSKDLLVTIGAHTVTHPTLAKLDAASLLEEIEFSRRRLEEEIGSVVHHFAYPFGKSVEAGSREFEMVRSLGFRTAVTTRIGHLFPEHARHLECLPRISLNRATDQHVLPLQESGLLPLVFHRGRRFVTD